MIKLKNVSKYYKLYDKQTDRIKEIINKNKQYYKKRYALNNISIEIDKGEFIGIIGKNGAGKSTLLKAITGVIKPSSGEVIVEGRISSLLELGTTFNMELNGIDNIILHGQLHGLTNEEIESKKQSIIDFAEIGEYINQPVKTYSSGMFARLAFAAAIHVEPDILIVDEALSVGDTAFQLKCMRKMNEFREKGVTILYVSHNLREIIDYCQRVFVISDGKLIGEGSAKEMVDLYKMLITPNISLDDKNEVITESKNESKKNKDITHWKELFEINPHVLEYGDKSIEIIDYGIFDLNNNPAYVINHDKEYLIKMKVKFNTTVFEPIFALAIKDIKGQELCGTNTLNQKINTGCYKEGTELIITFRQKLSLLAGNYTISLGVTSYNDNGDLNVYHRLYDAIIFEIGNSYVINGVFDIYSNITIE